MKKRKTYEISVIDKAYSKIISDETKFYTSDTALELAFELKETEYNFESAEIVLLNVDDRSLATRPVSKTNDGFVYEIDDDVTTHYGDWRGQLMLVENGDVHVSSPIKFRIENDLYCNKPLEITEVVSWVSLKRNANGLIDELKQAVLSADGIEDTFNENETDRQTTFETNESERDKTFNTNEATRQENEDVRIEAEKQREGTVSEIENRQTFVENQFSVISQELTDKDVISAPEIIAARGGEPTLANRLDETDAQLAQIEQQKISHGEVTVSDIDKNKGKLDQTYMSDEFLQQMAGTTPINAVPADGSITTEKLAENSVTADKLVDVTKKPKTANLFNKNDILEGGYFRNDNGNWQSSSTISSSNFIPINPYGRYIKTETRDFVLWDKDKNRVGGGYATQNITATENTAYVTFAFSNAKINTTMLWEVGTKEEGYVPYEETYVLGDSWSLENVNSGKTTKDLFLRIPTPYNDGTTDAWATHQTTHPSIHQFETKWNGYKFWMAHTPYPDGKNPFENPCIAVSNNGIKWEEPKGISNPIVDKPVDGYNSDTHILYNNDTLKLEVWYRERINSIDKETLFRVVSSDGSVWSEPEEMISVSGQGAYNLLSPSIIRTDGEYKMWVTKDEYVVYMTSADGKTWSEPVNVLSNGQRIWSWHANVVLHEGKYHMLNRRDGYVIRYSQSEVGKETEFSEQEVIFGIDGNEWDLDGDFLYRASPIFTKRGVMVIYGATSQRYKWTMMMVSGRDFYNLKPITQKAFDFYGIE